MSDKDVEFKGLNPFIPTVLYSGRIDFFSSFFLAVCNLADIYGIMKRDFLKRDFLYSKKRWLSISSFFPSFCCCCCCFGLRRPQFARTRRLSASRHLVLKKSLGIHGLICSGQQLPTGTLNRLRYNWIYYNITAKNPSLDRFAAKAFNTTLSRPDHHVRRQM